MAGLLSCMPRTTGSSNVCQLMMWCEFCHVRKYEVAERLGQCGADVNVRDKNGSTAYDIASVIGNVYYGIWNSNWSPPAIIIMLLQVTSE